jgi:hypothetical protein
MAMLTDDQEFEVVSSLAQKVYKQSVFQKQLRQAEGRHRIARMSLMQSQYFQESALVAEYIRLLNQEKSVFVPAFMKLHYETQERSNRILQENRQRFIAMSGHLETTFIRASRFADISSKISHTALLTEQSAKHLYSASAVLTTVDRYDFAVSSVKFLHTTQREKEKNYTHFEVLQVDGSIPEKVETRANKEILIWFSEDNKKIYDKLFLIEELFAVSWEGAVFALETDKLNNPDYVRHVSISLRELLKSILKKWAPKEAVLEWGGDKVKCDKKGYPTREWRLKYIYRDVRGEETDLLVEAHNELMKRIFHCLEEGVHGKREYFSEPQLEFILDDFKFLLNSFFKNYLKKQKYKQLH